MGAMTSYLLRVRVVHGLSHCQFPKTSLQCTPGWRAQLRIQLASSVAASWGMRHSRGREPKVLG